MLKKIIICIGLMLISITACSQKNPCLSPVEGGQFLPCSFGIPPEHATYTGIACPDAKGMDDLIVTNRKCYKCDEGYVYGGLRVATNACVPKPSITG